MEEEIKMVEGDKRKEASMEEEEIKMAVEECRYMKREEVSKEGGMYSNNKKKLMANKKRKMVDKEGSKMLRLKDSSHKEMVLKKVSKILY